MVPVLQSLQLLQETQMPLLPPLQSELPAPLLQPSLRAASRSNGSVKLRNTRLHSTHRRLRTSAASAASLAAAAAAAFFAAAASVSFFKEVRAGAAVLKFDEMNLRYA